MTDVFTPIFSLVAGLLLAFVVQVGIVSALTAFIKDAFSLDGNTVRIVSFVIGFVLGGLMLWVAIDLGQSTLPVSAWVLVGVLFMPGAGLVASGYYDYQKKGFGA